MGHHERDIGLEKSALNKIIDAGQHVVIETDPSTYDSDCAALLVQLSKRKNVVFITFQANTRDMVLDYEDKGGDISRLFAIDAVSIISGKGTPPVPKLITVYRPDNFNEIEIYTNLFIRELGAENVCVFILAVQNIELYQDSNEVGIFLRVYHEMLRSRGISLFMPIDGYLNFTFYRILLVNSDKSIKLIRE